MVLLGTMVVAVVAALTTSLSSTATLASDTVQKQLRVAEAQASTWVVVVPVLPPYAALSYPYNLFRPYTPTPFLSKTLIIIASPLKLPTQLPLNLNALYRT